MDTDKKDKELGFGLTCFIVGPIGDRLEPPGTEGRLRYEQATQMWESVFEPVCQKFGMTPVRADKIAESGDIPEQIFTFLRDADVVIADLTGGNANVMYELGLRHTRDKITIQIGQHERLPFDVNTIRTVKFKRTEAGLIDARNALEEAVRAALMGEGKPVTATRVWNELASLEPSAVAAASAKSFEIDDPEDREDDDAPGQLDMLATGEEAMEGIGETMARFTANLESLGALSEDLGAKAEAAEGFAQRLTLIRKYADDLQPTAGEMEESSAEFLTQISSIDSMMQLIIAAILEDTDDSSINPGILEFMGAVKGMMAASAEATIGMTSSLHGVRQLRKMSNILRPISKSLEQSINSILRGQAIIAGWEDRLSEWPAWADLPTNGYQEGDADGGPAQVGA